MYRLSVQRERERMLNINKMFTMSKSKSVPIVRVPKKIKDMLNICQAYENGIFQVNSGKSGQKLYDRCYAFEDINFINQDENNKEGILLQLCAWLNSMKSEFKISLCNEYQDMQQLVQELFTNANEKEYPLLAKGMNQWVEEKLENGTPDVKKVMYLVVTVRAKDFNDANIYFNMLDNQLQMLFTGWGSKLLRLDVHTRLKCLKGFLRNKYEYSADEITDYRNDILPVSLKQHKNYLELDNSCVSILHGFKFRKSIDADKFLYRLSELPYPSIVTVDYAPIPSEVLESKVAAARMNNEKAIANEIQRKNNSNNYAMGISYKNEKEKTELENYTDQIESNDENGFFVGLLIMVTAPDDTVLKQRIDSITAIGNEQGVELEIYNYRQLKALNTVLPFGGRQVDHMRTMLTTSLVALQPYYAQNVIEMDGYLYGTNRTTKKLIVGNRKKLKNPHGMIVGHTGSGKSMLIKSTEIAQTILRTSDDLLFIDPQNEFQHITNDLGGTYLDFTPKSKIHLNSLEIPGDLFKKEKENEREYFITRQSEYLVAFCTAVMKRIEVTQIHDSIIGRCTRILYQDMFSGTNLKLKKQPTLIDFRKVLNNEMKKDENIEDIKLMKEIYTSLEEYTEGAYDMFSKKSNVDFSSRMIGFGIRNVSEKNWEAVMITIMHFLSNRMEFNKDNQRATRFIVDETQVVCNSRSSASMLLNAIVTFRKFGGICTLAIQNMTRGLEHPELRDMFSNCEYKVFLDQGGVDAKALSEIQELTAMEYRSLSEDKPGCGIMTWGKKVLLMDAYMSHDNALYDMFSTNFHEKAEASS